MFLKKKKKSLKVDWQKAPDIKKRINILIKALDLSYIKKDSIFAFRSYNSKAYAYARIWGMGKIWQMALDTKPSYVVEVLSEKFDNLNQEFKDEVLLHELAHIPKNFSGALVPHKKGKGNFHDKLKKMKSLYKDLI